MATSFAVGQAAHLPPTVYVPGKRSEARCRYYVRDEAKRLGWDVRHPQAGGQFLEEQELVDFFPSLRKVLGQERPDFGAIGTDKKLRAVIECKNDITGLDRAVNEACEYSNKINATNHFDVRIAVGVAGTPDRFVQTRTRFLRGHEWIPLQSHFFPLTQLPTLFEIDTAIKKADGTTDVQLPEESAFADAAISVNNILRLAKVEERMRPRVLGAIILALYAGEFSLASRTVLEHINANVKAAIKEFKDVDADRRQLLTDTLTLGTSIALKEYVEPIVHQLERLNVRSIVRSGVDFLGKFYEAFMRYGSDSKQMGIVFTPRHITELCANLVNVKLGHKVYDPAAGSGGFLVAAFDRMMREATTEKAKTQVRSSLFGCDTNDTVWALAMLNMFFRGDGKSSIFYGSCFHQDYPNTFDRVLMNPPFSQAGEPETDFINHGLESLKAGGMMAVVVKAGVVVDEALTAWRRAIVAAHQIIAVISLPADLFYPTASPTVILIVKAHAPSVDQGTFVARIENDGYEISKKRRVPRPGSVLPKVSQLLSEFMERGKIDTVPGIACVVPRTRLVDGADVCAEKWLPSEPFGMQDYEQHKSRIIRDLSLVVACYQDITDQLIDDYEQQLASIEPEGSIRPRGRANLDAWFSISNGLSQGQKHYPDGSVPYVSSGEPYNSISGFIEPIDPFDIYDSPCISITGFGKACIQPWRFCARGNGGSAVRIATPRFPMTLAELIWFVGQINSQQWRFYFARMATAYRLKALSVDPPPKDLASMDGLAARLLSFKSGLTILEATASEDASRSVPHRFAALVEEWKRDRGPRSSIAKMAMHPAYQQIIGLGRPAVPLLLSEMEKAPSHWSWALRAITGVDPVPKASRGRLLETAAAWIKWGKAQGIEW